MVLDFVQEKLKTIKIKSNPVISSYFPFVLERNMRLGFFICLFNKYLFMTQFSVCICIWLRPNAVIKLTFFSVKMTRPSSWSSNPFMVTVKSIIDVLALTCTNKQKLTIRYNMAHHHTNKKYINDCTVIQWITKHFV